MGAQLITADGRAGWRLCTLGLPVEGVAPALMRALCREASCEAGVVLWFEAHGEISNLYAHDPPSPQVLR